MLQEEAEDLGQQNFTPDLQKIHSAGKHLLTLINDILDLSKIEADRMELVQEPFSVEQLVSDVIQMMTFPAGDKKLALDRIVAPHLPAVVYGDAQRLRQVLVNLVGNAVKFTDKGGIHIAVVQEDEGVFRVRGSGGNNMEHQKQSAGEHPPSVLLRFSVQDTGIGIPTDKIAEIFHPFTQADNSHARKHGGIGLGLAIVKRLVDMMGGRVWVESVKGQGSTFHFTARLSLQPAPGPEEPLSIERPPIRRGLRVLVVEDDATSGLLASEILKTNGHEATQAFTGPEALEALTRPDFDLVLMDVMMPGMDGLEVARQIRSPASGVRNHAIPVIAMTANAMKGDEATCLHAGMNAYIAKPINPSDLQAVIDKVMLACQAEASPR
ncbi:MAG: response regulator, partial [Lentisphaerae bacterium]|nr:response regulator [Lentisphaerota bacterium]